MSKDESWEEILGEEYCKTPIKETPSSKDDPWVYERKNLPKPKFQTKLCQDDEKIGDILSRKITEEPFEPDDLETTLRYFAHPWHKDRLHCNKVKANCYKWIIYHVTKGRYRMSPRGIMSVFFGEPGIHNIFHYKRKWVKIPQYVKEANLEAIAQECNVVLEALRAKVTRLNSKRALDRVTRQNLEKMPDFVSTAQHRNILHKTCKWHHVGEILPDSQGGGFSKPGRPTPNKHLAVDTILKEYDRFIPKIPTTI